MPGIPSGNNIPTGGNVLTGGFWPSGNNIPSTSVSSPPGLTALRFWHTAQNIDGSNNSTLIDGQALGTWKNMGTLGATGDLTQATAGSKPRFDRIAVSGKINNLSAVECLDNIRSMATGAFTTIPQPYQVAFVWRSTQAATQIVTTGSPNTPQIWTVVGPGGHLNCSAPTATDTGLAVSANTFHTCVVTFNGAASVARIDGVASSAFNPGATGFTSTMILLSAAGALGIVGYLVEHLVYATPQLGSDIESYFSAVYGAFPQ